MTKEQFIAKFKKVHNAIEWKSPPNQPPERYVWCCGVRIQLPIARKELVRRIRELHEAGRM